MSPRVTRAVRTGMVGLCIIGTLGGWFGWYMAFMFRPCGAGVVPPDAVLMLDFGITTVISMFIGFALGFVASMLFD